MLVALVNKKQIFYNWIEQVYGMKETINEYSVAQHEPTTIWFQMKNKLVGFILGFEDSLFFVFGINEPFIILLGYLILGTVNKNKNENMIWEMRAFYWSCPMHLYRIVPNIQSFTFLTKHEKGLSNEIHKVRNIWGCKYEQKNVDKFKPDEFQSNLLKYCWAIYYYISNS